MKKKTRIAWQSREPKFPKQGLVVAVWLQGPDMDQAFPLPLSLLISDLGLVHDYVLTFKKEVRMRDAKISFLDDVLLQTVEFDRLVPLRRVYWQSPTVHVDGMQRMSVFTKMFRHFSFYQLLVTPNEFVGELETFSVGFPFLTTSVDTILDPFLRSSDLSVDPTAKHAALYVPQEPVGYNWIKHEYVKKSRVSNKK